MNTTMQIAVSILMLGGAIWSILFLFPKARREQDTFGIICSLLIDRKSTRLNSSHT